MKFKSQNFKNPRTGEIWVCEDIKQSRIVDGVKFIEVFKPENSTRKVWMNFENLVKIKEPTNK